MSGLCFKLMHIMMYKVGYIPMSSSFASVKFDMLNIYIERDRKRESERQRESERERDNRCELVCFYTYIYMNN